MQPQQHEPLQSAYLALAALEHRIIERDKLIDDMATLMIAYPALFTIGQAEPWKETMLRLIDEAKKLQKEEAIEH